MKDAKRYVKSLDGTEGDAVIDNEIEGLFELLSPYSKQILGIGDGNHEETIIRQCGTNPVKRLAEKLGTKYLGYSWLFNLKFTWNGGAGKTLTIRGHHGWGGNTRTAGGDLTKYSHDCRFWDADLFLYGHTHNVRSCPIEVGKLIGDNKWKTFVRYMVVCGTYQRTYTDTATATYAERMGFPPTSIRTPRIILRPASDFIEMTVQH